MMDIVLIIFMAAVLLGFVLGVAVCWWAVLRPMEQLSARRHQSNLTANFDRRQRQTQQENQWNI